jgi:segregation and condensation protein A
MPEWAELESFLPDISKKAPQYRSAVAAHFGAALELVKEGYANIKQETKFSPILLRSKREQND